MLTEKDWSSLLKETIEIKLNSLSKHQVFVPVVQTPKCVKSVDINGYLVRKENENNEITRYKAKLVAQVFS